jgi:hypothetical protein
LASNRCAGLSSTPDLTSVLPETRLGNSLDPELELQEVRQAIAEARDWLAGFKWCSRVVRSFWGWGIPPTLSICLFEIEPTNAHVDRWLWTVTGDVPPAYLVTDNARKPREALEVYVFEMGLWVRKVRAHEDLTDVIPVDVPRTDENADLLESRLNFVETEILNDWDSLWHPETQQ